jgi:hypothetical protein
LTRTAAKLVGLNHVRAISFHTLHVKMADRLFLVILMLVSATFIYYLVKTNERRVKRLRDDENRSYKYGDVPVSTLPSVVFAPMFNSEDVIDSMFA